MASSSSAPASPAPSHALFLASSAYLPTAPSAASLPTEVKLRLYGLFKLLSTPPSGGDVSGAGGPPTARPSFWQVEARSKWDAWAAAEKEFGSKGEDGRTDARRAYVEIARSVGFEGAQVVMPDQQPPFGRPLTVSPRYLPPSRALTETEQTAAAAPVEDDVDLEHLSSDDERDRQAEQHARPAAGSGSTSAATERKPGGGGVGGKSISRLRETLPEPAEGAVEAETDPLSYVDLNSLPAVATTPC